MHCAIDLVIVLFRRIVGQEGASTEQRVQSRCVASRLDQLRRWFISAGISDRTKLDQFDPSGHMQHPEVTGPGPDIIFIFEKDEEPGVKGRTLSDTIPKKPVNPYLDMSSQLDIMEPGLICQIPGLVVPKGEQCFLIRPTEVGFDEVLALLKSGNFRTLYFDGKFTVSLDPAKK